MIEREDLSKLVLPSAEQARLYQEWASGLLMGSMDPSTGLIARNGLKPLAYCLRGIEEETEEIIRSTDADQSPLDNQSLYNRLGAVLGLVQTDNDPQSSILEAIRHQKEFGDTIWYTSCALQIEGWSMAACVEEAARKTQRQPRSVISGNGMLPGIRLVTAIDDLRSSTFEYWLDWPIHFVQTGENVSDPDQVRSLGYLKMPDDRIRARTGLITATSDFILASAGVLQSIFDTTFPEILEQNIAKIEQRIANNTVYKVNGVGGDDR